MTNLNMNRSEYILKRLMLLRTLEAPTISDTKRNFGDDLAEKIFCNCDLNFREDFGLEPPLKGPIGKDLWISPSDLLIGKVCLKPPLTSKYIRALTHQGIMDIGLRVEKLFWNQVEIEKSKELEEQDRTLRLLCETSKKESIAEVQKRMMEIFRRQRLELINEMEALCKEELRRMEVRYYRELDDELKEQAKELEQHYQVKVEEVITKTSEVFSVKSTSEIEELEAAMKRAYQIQLQKTEIQARFEMQQEQARCKEKLKVLRHDLECKNLANMMYVICMERKKCWREKSSIEEQLSREINELGSQLRDRNEEITNIKAEREKLRKDVELREKALLEVIKEFQKFINFALKSVPKQAEYLLCAEKLMVFDLTEALSKVGNDDHDRNYLWDRTPQDTPSTQVSLKAKDGHECLKEPEISESELSVDQFLPGFYYNDQLFVREDFRNMVSQGITINENNMLWTQHVQDVQKAMDQPCQSCVFNEQKEAEKKPYAIEKKRSIISYQSSVHFSMKESKKPSTMSMDKDKKFRRASLKPIEAEEILQSINFGHIGSEENRKTLLSAKNSVELLKESLIKRRSSIKSEEVDKLNQILKEREKYHNFENLSEEKEITTGVLGGSKLLIDTRDSVVQAKVHKVLSSSLDVKKLEVTEAKRQYSKLITSQDSVELIKRKESIASDKKPEKKEIKCLLPDCNILKYASSEKEEVKEEEIADTELEDNYTYTTDTPKRVSIAFTGKSIIYNRDEDEEDVEEELEEVKKKLIKTKKKRTHFQKRRKIGTSQGKPATTVSTETSKETENSRRTEQKLVMGDSTFKFYNQSDAQFTADRVNSFLHILKEHPNLIRLFTSVTR
ncbi:hypothetical protein HHI36_007846 [Cryptolaemus montrouzieri]|uniref:Uncharacterized protein n=1 Tax=Cryptolaemus montrouzieri TaxID=559131 RepID=A0ABD2MR78_9CUCU